MENERLYPIGIQTFPEIIEGNYLYVDKTALIYRLVNRTKYVFLSRPRRFGKSLLVSTIQAYFEGRKDLFKNLAMTNLEKDWIKYPVLRVDLSNEDYLHLKSLVVKIKSILRDWENSFGLPPVDDPDEEDSLGTRFARIIKHLHTVSGQPVVVLIDEYDKPLLDSLHDDSLHDEMKSKLHGFYSTLKNCDEFIRFALLTGVTKFTHVSIFSGLNNLKDISLNPDYNAICGISESEFKDNFAESVSDFSKATGWTEEQVWQAFKYNYDGYHFSGNSEGVYNPFSILWAFDDHRIGHYWFASGTPSFLGEAMRKYNYNLSDIEGGKFTESQLSDISKPDKDYHALFFQAGYLTVKGFEPATLGRIPGRVIPEKYTLGFPNMEVKSGFWNSLYTQYVFHDKPSAEFDSEKFIEE